MELKNKRTAVYLTVLWIVSFLFAFIFAAIARAKSHISGGYEANLIDSVGAYLISGLYFFPLVLQIRKYAQSARMSKLSSLANYMAVIYTGALILSPIAFLISLLAK